MKASLPTTCQVGKPGPDDDLNGPGFFFKLYVEDNLPECLSHRISSTI